MHATALPAGGKYPADCRLQPFMRIRDDQLNPAQAALRQALQKTRPEGLGFRGADMQPHDLAPVIGVGRHDDYCGDRDDAAAFALLQVSGVKPNTLYPIIVLHSVLLPLNSYRLGQTGSAALAGSWRGSGSPASSHCKSE